MSPLTTPDIGLGHLLLLMFPKYSLIRTLTMKEQQPPHYPSSISKWNKYWKSASTVTLLDTMTCPMLVLIIARQDNSFCTYTGHCLSLSDVRGGFEDSLACSSALHGSGLRPLSYWVASSTCSCLISPKGMMSPWNRKDISRKHLALLRQDGATNAISVVI
jgi:hypothetical protein